MSKKSIFFVLVSFLISGVSVFKVIKIKRNNEIVVEKLEQELIKKENANRILLRQTVEGIRNKYELMGKQQQQIFSNRVLEKLEVLLSKNLLKLRKEMSVPKKTGFHQDDRIPLDATKSVAEKVELIISKFRGGNSYRHNNVNAKKIISFGTPAIAPLIKNLMKRGRKTISESLLLRECLAQLLKREDKGLILKAFRERGQLEWAIKKYLYPEVKNLVLQRLITKRANQSLSEDLIDTAFLYDKDQAANNLKLYVGNGREPSYAIKKIFRETEVDLSEELKQLLQRKNNVYAKKALFSVLIGEGHKGSLNLALDILEYKGKWNVNSLKRSVLEKLRVYTNLSGDENQVRRDLKKNLNDLIWDANTRKFVKQ